MDSKVGPVPTGRGDARRESWRPKQPACRPVGTGPMARPIKKVAVLRFVLEVE